MSRGGAIETAYRTASRAASRSSRRTTCGRTTVPAHITAATTEGRALRHIEWSYDPAPNDTTYVTEMVHVLREGDSTPRLDPTVVPLEHSEVEPRSHELFVATKPAKMHGALLVRSD